MEITIDYKQRVLQGVVAAGGRVVVDVPVLEGHRTMTLTAAQAVGLTEDKTSVFAELLGLSRAEYVEWHQSQGCVHCNAYTKKGTICRNSIVGATLLEPATWLKQRTEGGYCQTHGG